VILVVGGLSLAALRAAAEEDFAAVDEAVRAAVASGEIPGAVVLVGRGDQILFHRAWGWRALVPAPEPMTTDTIFDVASLTKPLGTSLAILSLAEQGRLRLDAPLGRYLSEFRQPAHRRVTLERLLAHTAGFPAIPPSAALAGGFPGAARALARLPLDFPPGSGFQYSDTGFILLGEVVRRVSGWPLDVYLERFVFRPLGLRDTTFHPTPAMRARVAPTEYADGALLRGRVHDPRARILGGVAGHAGMFSTAADLARLVQMLLRGGELDGHRVLQPASVRRLWTPWPEADGQRTLGWDATSPFARALGWFFPPGSVGHTGFTGTALWVDPQSRTYVILLTNRGHPGGGGAAAIRELRMRVAAAVGAALFRPPGPWVVTAPSRDGRGLGPGPRPAVRILPVGTPPVRPGLEVLAEHGFALLRGHRVGLVTNHTGVDTQGRRAIDLLAHAPGVRLTAVFTPEHGLSGEATGEVGHARDERTGVPVWSLYGPTRRPTPEMLRGVSVLVVDLQDVGVRYYTYLTTLVYVLESAARHGLPVIVLDRPNPITGRVVEGPIMDADLVSFTGVHPVPVRTGLTLGEFARLVTAERRLPVALTVVPVAGWERAQWYDETGLRWIHPSPNIRSVTQALLYAGVGLLEGTNVSVGRGTETPFEVVGAPWIEPAPLAAALNARGLPGIRFEPVTFTPAADKYAGLLCGGVRLVVTDRAELRPVTVGLAVARALRDLHREAFRPESMQYLLAHRPTLWALLRDEPLEHLVRWAEAGASAFLARRAPYLIYR
jgi:uncharacterized protein YbbC (DUF1343 family)/CubicO group peptidase (beta-lactamase class C family)